MKKIAKAVHILISLLSITACTSMKGTGVLQEGYIGYDIRYFADNYHSTLNSNLSIFPEKLISTEENTIYRGYVTLEFFDDPTEIYLSYVYNEEQYLSEVERIKNISMTIKYKSQEYTNYIKYNETSYKYPAYITIDGFSGQYEYALLLKENYQIVYMYLDVPGNDQIKKYPDYVKIDTSSYQKSSNNSFSLYNHSFDGGQSWVEFDD